MQEFFIVYQITNLLDNRIYVGAHVTKNINDSYMGSSKYLRKDISNLGKQNFKKEILFIFDNKEDMLAKEAEIVDKTFCFRNDTYNRIKGGINSFDTRGMFVGKDKNGNTILTYSDDPRFLSGEIVGATKGRPGIKSMLGKKRDEETKRKIGEKNKINSTGRKQSEKTKEKKRQIAEQINSIKCFVYNLNGDFLSEERSMSECSNKYNLIISAIQQVLSNKSLKAGEYQIFNDFKGEKIDPYKRKYRKKNESFC